jgi:hypothetical protein
MGKTDIKFDRMSVLTLIVIMGLAGIFFGLNMLGVFEGYLQNTDSIFVGIIVIGWSATLLLETFYESPGIKDLKDLAEPLTAVCLAISIMGFIVGVATAISYVIPANLESIVGIVFIALSVGLWIELKQ